VFDFAKNMKLGSLTVAIGFHRLEVIREKFSVSVFVFFLECIPRGPHLRFQQVGQLGLSRCVFGRRARGGFVRCRGLLGDCNARQRKRNT
jgi:hypothetical protein